MSKYVLTAGVFLLTACLMLPLVGCGGGGGGDDGSGGGSPLTGTMTLNAAASPGDLLVYTLDFDNLTYSYSVVAGTAIQPASGSGTLTPIADAGTRVFRASGGADVTILPNGLAVIELDSGEIIAGLPANAVAFAPADIAGMYNYVSWTGGNFFSYGTFEIVADGTYKAWDQVNGATVGGAGDENGTWVDQGNGVLRASTDGGTTTRHNVLIRPSPSGNLLVVDNVFDAGITLGVKQIPFPEAISNTFNVVDSSEPCLYSVTANGVNVTIPTDPCNSSDTTSATLMANTPWTGFGFLGFNDGTGDISDYVLLSPDGMYFGGGKYNDNSEHWVWAATAR